MNHSGLIEDKVERALLDLNEYKNNFMVEKIGYEQKIEQSNKDQRMRQTFYETNYKTTKSFFSNRPTSSKLTGQALTDGNILSNIDNISINELKERLIVAETIMKKLYARNKDLETGV